MVVYAPRSGDIISLDNEKAGALTMSTSLENYYEAGTNPIRMWLHRDAFRTVTEAIASAGAFVPYNVYERDADNNRVKLSAADDKVAAALDRPQPRKTSFRHHEALWLDWLLHDRWAFMVDVQEDGSLRFHRLPAKNISFVIDGLGQVTDVALWGKRGVESGDPALLPIKFAVFDVGYEPNGSAKYASGTPISRSLEASATELDLGAKFRKDILIGGPKVPMYIQRPAEAPEWIKNGGRARFIETFRSYSTERAGQTPILEDGMKLVEAPQVDLSGAALQEARKQAQIEVCIALHVSPEIIGYREGNFSNVQAYREQWYVDTLGWRIAAFRQALQVNLQDGGYLSAGRYIEENIGARLAGDPQSQASILQTQVGAPVRTVNEARTLINLPRVDGGDDLIVPLNVTKGGLASPTDTGKQNRTSSLLLPAGLKAIETAARASSDEFKAAEQTQIDRFEAALQRAFGGLGKRVLAGLGKDQKPRSLDEAFQLEAEIGALAAIIYPHAYQLAQHGASGILAKFNPDGEGFDPEVMLPWLYKASQGTAGDVVFAVQNDLAQTIFEDDWRAKAEGIFTTLALSGAALWSSTVSTTAVNFGSQDAAKASGLDTKTWRHRSGKASRKAHINLDGETVAAHETFSNGMRWPGDPTGGADNNANCHCRLEWSRGDA